MSVQTDAPFNGRKERAWKDVARFLAVAWRLLDEDLQSGVNVSLIEYAVLVHLSEAETGHLRVSRLAEIADLSESWMTHLVKTLPAAGS